MALTPDDVVTKQFQHVRFKEGFDPDEVDDFLDEIVVEWRKTIEENEQLKAKLAAYESGETPTTAVPAAEAEESGAAAGTAAPATPAITAEETAAAVSADGAPPTTASAGIIELAQRLHDEHVAEGKAKGEQLVADAQAEATKIVSDAEQKQREVTEKLERERTTLEGRITELRQFERDYRSQLRSYFEAKLKDLDSPGEPTSGSTPVSAVGL